MSSVAYDHRAITIDGTRTLLLSGAIHYPRSTPAMWPTLMERSRDAGLNTIETYVFWNLHERRRGVLDFADRLDLPRFCQLAADHGLHVVLRIGPYICSETNYGGFPFWLRDVPGIQFRTFNEPFLREMGRWVRLLCDVVRPHFASQGGPIILAQVENEYGNVAKTYGADGQRYLDWCVDLTRSVDVGVPWLMCVGATAGILESINGFYAHDQLPRHFQAHPDQPALWTEHWPGWYDTYGYPHHVRPAEDVAYAAARFFAAGGTGMNYYMWHGGTNFGRESMFLQTTCYDFDCPLDEFALPTTKCNHLAALHHILADSAPLLLGGDPPEPERLGEDQTAFEYAQGKDSIAFLCNDGRSSATVTFRGRRTRLAARAVAILINGRRVYNSANVTPAHQVRRSLQREPTALSSFESWAEPTPRHWPRPLHTRIVAPEPLEQLALTHDTSDYCWYSARLDVSRKDAGTGPLVLEAAADVVHVLINGRLRASTPAPLPENRGPVDGEGYRHVFDIRLSHGRHALTLLCSAIGLIKGDWMLGHRNMTEERKGIWGPVTWKGKPIAGPWKIQPGLMGEACRVFAEGGALVPWRATTKARPHCWLRATFPRPEGDEPLLLDLGPMTKGIAWLNGRCIGRYWLAPGTGTSEAWLAGPIRDARIGEPTQRYYHLPLEWLEPTNTLVLFEEVGGDPTAIRLCRKA